MNMLYFGDLCGKFCYKSDTKQPNVVRRPLLTSPSTDCSPLFTEKIIMANRAIALLVVACFSAAHSQGLLGGLGLGLFFLGGFFLDMTRS
jgi:hypothetical protein